MLALHDFQVGICMLGACQFALGACSHALGARSACTGRTMQLRQLARGAAQGDAPGAPVGLVLCAALGRAWGCYPAILANAQLGLAVALNLRLVHASLLQCPLQRVTPWPCPSLTPQVQHWEWLEGHMAELPPSRFKLLLEHWLRTAAGACRVETPAQLGEWQSVGGKMQRACLAGWLAS